MLIFEGSEKKLEVVIDRTDVDLRELGSSFWTKIVTASAAEIISSISSPVCDAYLLSESSLFVWNDRFTMITCGQTKLAQAAEVFLQEVKHPIASLFFQRKNELFPNMQHSDFSSDVAMLNTHTPGTTYRFGDTHFNNIFYHEAAPILHNTTYAEDDTTFELLMYNLGEKASNVFMNHTKEKIRNLLAASSLYSIFDIDEFLFEPFGYSVNGLKGKHYFTIHVTPQEECSYASFETNLPLPQARDIIQALVDAFAPKSFDTVVFCDIPNAPVLPNNIPLQEAYTKRLGNKYYVHFTHHGESK